MRGLSLISVCIFLIVTSAAALAQDEGQWNRHEGFYGELNLGSNLVYLGVISSEADTSAGGFHSFGWNAAVGYNFNPSHAIEAGFMQNYARFDKTQTIGGREVDVAYSTHTNVPYIAWRGTVPIQERFAFFGKVGAMLLEVVDVSGWVVLPYTGIGASYAITPRIDFSVQYQGAFYLLAGAGLLSGGITYHF